MSEKTSIGEIIVDSVELRERYEAIRPKYDRLVDVVSLILNAAIEKQKIKLHSFKQRVKDYSSFLEKVERKRYKDDPFRQCTDLAGCRIICLFSSQITEIQKIIEQEFNVIEVSDKRSTKKFDQFGYLSLHMLVSIPKERLKYVEYSDLDRLVCEIQIRTILQEAWAEIEHYLNYKATKEEKNDALLRKIFSLAGMFEVADSTFEEIHEGFSTLVSKKLETVEEGITALSLYKFSQEYFPWFSAEWDKKQERSFYTLSREIKRINIKSLSQLKEILDKHSKELELYEKVHQDREQKKDRYFVPVGLIRAALALEFGNKFDLIFGLKDYSQRIRKDLNLNFDVKKYKKY